MKKVQLFFSNLFKNLLKKRPKTLQVIFRFSPSLEILVDYYDSSWSQREGAMFERSYSLRYALRSIYEAVEYAMGNGYDLLQIDVIEFLDQPPKTLKVMPVR